MFACNVQTPSRRLVLLAVSLIYCGHFLQAAERLPLPSPAGIAQLPPDGGPEFNRLVFEKSPYLLQHARNPVDWWPWGEDAFALAKEEGKLIFLSIGYSTCHWCHVMEHESFEDAEVAALMNKDFVCIKVDREERPDLDEVYMSFTVAMTGSGGWPMTVVLTPERKPIFAGTYFPKQSVAGRIGMMDLLPRITEVWTSDPSRLLESADKITAAIAQRQEGKQGGEVPESILDTARDQLIASFDSQHGGFGGAPKFPSPHQYTFLLRQWKRTGDPELLAMVETSLRAMRNGGIYDQIGFGFHRYSTDGEWHVPHFEKMLYDQATLALAYAELYQATQKPEYAQTVQEIFTYLLRDMTSPEGAFYSAEDADSEGEEGKFYVWSEAELRTLLTEEEADLFIRRFDVQPGGNWAEGRAERTNVLRMLNSLEEDASALGLDVETAKTMLESARAKLFDVREARPHPYKDDKVLTDWNGLMIAALSLGGRALDDDESIGAARRAADFLLKTLRGEDGRLLHRYRGGEAGLTATLDDYAFFVWGLLELYESSFDIAYLKAAIELNLIMIDDFGDKEAGGFYLTSTNAEELLLRPKTGSDGAIPSGNSVAAMNCLRIGRMTANTELEKKAQEVFSAFGAQLNDYPLSSTQLLQALDFVSGPSYEVVIAGEAGSEEVQAMSRALATVFVPNKVLVFRPVGERPPIVDIAAYTEMQQVVGGKATAYICQNYACNLPVTDPRKALELLGITPSPSTSVGD